MDGVRADTPSTSHHNDAPNVHYDATLTGDSSIDSISSQQAATSVEAEIGERIDTHEALRALKDELSNIPHDEKSAFVHVQRVRPELVNDEHYMGFLTVEKFDIGVRTYCLPYSRPLHMLILYFHLYILLYKLACSKKTRSTLGKA